ncbi:MAG: hypothetical protein ABW035_04665, partial [Acidimicrobiales bacterium]
MVRVVLLTPAVVAGQHSGEFSLRVLHRVLAEQVDDQTLQPGRVIDAEAQPRPRQERVRQLLHLDVEFAVELIQGRRELLPLQP